MANFSFREIWKHRSDDLWLLGREPVQLQPHNTTKSDISNLEITENRPHSQQAPLHGALAKLQTWGLSASLPRLETLAELHHDVDLFTLSADDTRATVAATSIPQCAEHASRHPA